MTNIVMPCTCTFCQELPAMNHLCSRKKYSPRTHQLLGPVAPQPFKAEAEAKRNNETMRNYKITCNLNDFAYCRASYVNSIKEL